VSRLKLSPEQLKKMGIELPQKKYVSPFDRLKNAICIMENSKKDDEIYFNIKEKFCILILKDIKLISNNDLLRNDNRKVNKFKKLWHQRIVNIVKDNYIKDWDNFKSEKMILECLYKPSHGKFMDPDAISAAFKSPLDGLVEAGLLVDDKPKYLPLIIPRQEKNNEKRDDLIMVLTSIDDINKYYTNTFKNFIETNK